jgi:hypothetical protein
MASPLKVIHPTFIDEELYGKVKSNCNVCLIWVANLVSGFNVF